MLTKTYRLRPIFGYLIFREIKYSQEQITKSFSPKKFLDS
jgi:hypothetical protein